MIKKILNFGIVGILSTFIDFITLFILHSLLFLNLYISVSIAFCISLIFNFIFSMKYVFKNKKCIKLSKQLIIFITTALMGLLINQTIIYILNDNLNVHYMLAKIFSTAIVMTFNFISRYISFEK